MPVLRVHYVTVGDPSGEPVLVLHGTGGTGAGLLSPGFAGELFGPGQPLDARKYFVILPDAIGTTGFAKFWAQQLREFLQEAPKRAM